MMPEEDAMSTTTTEATTETAGQQAAQTAGASETTTETTKQQAGTGDDVAKLQAALEKERELRKTAERDAKDGKTAAEKLAEIEAANATEQEKAVKTARDEATQAERERSNTVLVRSEARALAAEANFQDPRDAVAMLEAEGHLKDIKVDDQGDVDTEALKAKIAEVADKKKYLLKPEQAATAGQAGIGVTGGEGQRAGSLTEAITAAVTKQQRTR